MGCNCGTKVAAVGGMEATNAALCHTCMYADHAPNAVRDGAVRCSGSGAAVELHIRGMPCPMNKHTDSRGVTRWAFLEWYGLAMPLRIWLWALHPSHRKPLWWPGCGCIKTLKDLWVRVQS